MVLSPRLGSYGQVHFDSLIDAATQADAESAREGASLTAASPHSRRYILVCLIGYAMSFVVFGSQVSILGPTLQGLASRLNVTDTELSPLFTALGVSCIVSGTPSGWVVDRYPTHYVLVASLLVEAGGFALVPHMPSVWSLTALYFCICFSYNFTNSAVFTALGWMFPGAAGSALNLVLAAFGVGSFCIPLAAQLCAKHLGSSVSVFYLVSAVSLAAAVPFLFVTSPKRPALLPPIDVSAGAHHDDGGAASKLQRRSELLERVVSCCAVLLVFLSTCAETAIGNWVYTFSMKEASLTAVDAAVMNSAFWGFFTIGRICGAFLSHQLSPAALLLGSLPFAVAGCAVPLLVARTQALSYPVVMVLAALTGFGNSTGYANSVALMEQFVPVTGFINGIFGAVAGGACMVGPVLVAMLAEHTPLRYMSMPWVGLVLYSVHVPVILATLGAGHELLQLSERALAEGGDLQDPLLPGHTTSTFDPAAAPAAAATAAANGHGNGVGSGGLKAPGGLPPTAEV